MSKSAALHILNQSAIELQEQLKGEFLAFVVYGSLLQPHYDPTQSDLNTLLIVDEETNLNTIRRAFLPIWHQHKATFRRAPLIARPASLRRFLTIFPALANHLNRDGWLVRQGDFQFELPRLSDAVETKAYLANELFLASMTLATFVRDPAKKKRAQAALHRLQRRFGKGTTASTEPLPLLFRLQQQLGTPTPDLHSHSDAPYQIQGLVGLYEKLGDLIFVIESPADLLKTDWSKVSQAVDHNGFGNFAVITPDLFRLLVQKIYPLDHAILSYAHVWGTDVLTSITVSPSEVLRDAARQAIAYEIDGYPAVVLTTSASQDANGTIIHDFQNKLLNIRLQNELMARLKMSEKSGTSRLPDKSASQEVRLHGIWESFRYWGDYFYKTYEANTL